MVIISKLKFIVCFRSVESSEPKPTSPYDLLHKRFGFVTNCFQGLREHEHAGTYFPVPKNIKAQHVMHSDTAKILLR
jgi:hypothetical protein